MPLEINHLQSLLESALSGARFTSSNLNVLSLGATSDAEDGMITYSGEVMFFDSEMNLEVLIQHQDNALKGLTIKPKADLISKSLNLIGEFLAGDSGIENGNSLTNFFPSAFPIDRIAIKELKLGFAGSAANPTLSSIDFTLGTSASWTVLETPHFDIDEINVTLANDDLNKGFKNTELNIEGKFSFGSTSIALEVGNIELLSPSEVLQGIELGLSQSEVEIPLEDLMGEILPESAFETWQSLVPENLKHPEVDMFKMSLKPGSKEFHLVMESNLGNIEVMFKPVSGTVSNQSNILIALAPPSINDGFFSKIGGSEERPGPLAKLDSLDLTDSGIIFSTQKDEAEFELSSFRAHQLDDSPLEVGAGIQFFSNIKFRKDPINSADATTNEDEILLRTLFDLGDTSFSLNGGLEKDLTATLEVGVNFGDRGFQLIPNNEALIIRQASIGLILQPAPAYVGFTVGGVLDVHIQDADLRFDANLEFGTLLVDSSIVLSGDLEILALNGEEVEVTNTPAIWENAFGIPGLGMQEVGGNIGLGVVLGTVIPVVKPNDFGLKGTFVIGKVPGKEVYAQSEFSFDTVTPNESKVKAKLRNVSLLDIIEAYDEGGKFNIQGSVRELLDTGYDELEVIIDPANQEFYFDTELNLGTLEASAKVRIKPGEIIIKGEVTPILIQIPDPDPTKDEYKLFELKGINGNKPKIELNLQLEDPSEAKFVVQGDVTLLEEAMAGRADIDITPQKIFSDINAGLFDGAIEADLKLEAQAFSTDGAGMYMRAMVNNDGLNKLRTELRTKFEESFGATRAKIDKAKEELDKLRNQSGFLDTLVSIAQGALNAMKGVTEPSQKVGGMLLNRLDQGFSIDHIKFAGDLSSLGSGGSTKIAAEVQLTIAGQKVKPQINIDFNTDIKDIATTLKGHLLSSFNFLKDEFDELESQLKKAINYVANFARNAVESSGELFEDIWEDIKAFFGKVEDFVDETIQGRNVTPAKHGGPVAFPSGYRKYSIELAQIKNLMKDEESKLYGYLVVQPQGHIRLGNPSEDANLIYFSERHGDAFKINDGKTQKFDNKKKHFYVKETDRNAKITVRCALIDLRNGMWNKDVKYIISNNAAAEINLGRMEWSPEGELVRISLEGKNNSDYEIELGFRVTLQPKVTAEEMIENIRKENPHDILTNFKYGGDPNYPGLMAAAVEMPDYDLSYAERAVLVFTHQEFNIQSPLLLLLGKGVIPKSSDIERAIDLKRWDAMKLLLDNGAPPLPAHLTAALQKGISIKNFNKLLQAEILPTNENLNEALKKTNTAFAISLLRKNAEVKEANLKKAIELENLEMLELMLKNASDAALTGAVLQKAVEKGRIALFSALLKKPIFDQAIFQAALAEAGKRLKRAYFIDLIAAGARIQSNDIIDNILNALKSTEVNQGLVNDLIVNALRYGGDAAYALKQALNPEFAEVNNWQMVIQACVYQRVSFRTINVAFGKPTRQSSNKYRSAAHSHFAVDGNTSGLWADRSVTHTKLSTNPWWEVDLGRVYDIERIKIWNRKGSTSDRLSNFYIMASESPIASSSTSRDQYVSGPQSFVGDEPFLNFEQPKKARYVRIFINGERKILSLAEVELMAVQPLVNVALGKTTDQSTNKYKYEGHSQFAVDGNTSRLWENRSVTHTKLSTNPWWEVDLGSSYDIQSIKIWNRKGSTSHRLRDFYIMASESPIASSSTSRDQYVSGPQSFVGDEPFLNFEQPKKARYVRIFIKGERKILSMAEVEVMAVQPLTNVAVGKPTRQSSNKYRSVAHSQFAVDGDSSGLWTDRSVTHTKLSTNPWWEVDLGHIYDIERIKIWNREGSTSHRLRNFYIMASESPIAANSTSHDQYISGPQSFVGDEPFLNFEQPKRARYVRIFINGEQKILSLAEVEVMARRSFHRTGRD